MSIRGKAPKGINWSLVGTWFVAILLVTSTIGFLVLSGFNNNDESVIPYNGKLLKKDSSGIHTTVDNTKLDFTFEPSELDGQYSFYLQEAQDAILAAPAVYITSNSGDINAEPIGLVNYQIRNALEEKKGKYVQTGITGTNKLGAFVFTCANASVQTPVIFIFTGNQTLATWEKNCYTIQVASDVDLIRFRDRTIYSLFGIMK